MKKIQVAILVGMVSFSCSKKEKQEAGDWKELEAFHKVMADVYHPMKDSGNLVPARQLMTQLAEEAEKWSQTALPEKVNTPEVKEKLQKLKTDARTLADEIKRSAPDEAVKEGVTKLHEQFHDIMKAWYDTKEHRDEEEADDHKDH